MMDSKDITRAQWKATNITKTAMVRCVYMYASPSNIPRITASVRNCVST